MAFCLSGVMQLPKYIDGLMQDCSVPSALAMEIVHSYIKPLISIGLYHIMTDVTWVSLSDMHNGNTPALQTQRFVWLPDKSKLLYQGHFSLFMPQQMSVDWDMGQFPVKDIGFWHSAATFTLLEYSGNTDEYVPNIPVKLPWIFPGAPINGAPENIQDNLDRYTQMNCNGLI